MKVYVDWDNDGFIGRWKGVASAPKNKIKNALLMPSARLEWGTRRLEEIERVFSPTEEIPVVFKRPAGLSNNYWWYFGSTANPYSYLRKNVDYPINIVGEKNNLSGNEFGTFFGQGNQWVVEPYNHVRAIDIDSGVTDPIYSQGFRLRTNPNQSVSLAQDLTVSFNIEARTDDIQSSITFKYRFNVAGVDFYTGGSSTIGNNYQISTSALPLESGWRKATIIRQIDGAFTGLKNTFDIVIDINPTVNVPIELIIVDLQYKSTPEAWSNYVQDYEDFPVVAGTPFWISYYYKGNILSSSQFDFIDSNGNSTSLSALSTTNTDVGNGWYRRICAFSAPLSNGHLSMEINFQTTEVKGIMLTYEAPTDYNIGVDNSIDDITDYVLSANWKFGKSELEAGLPYDGTLEITLNNSDKRFSPAYGVYPFPLNATVLIENDDGERLVTMLTREYRVEAGKQGNLQATIVAGQGLEELNETLYKEVGSPNTVVEAVDNLLKYVGVQLPESLTVFRVGYSRLGNNTTITGSLLSRVPSISYEIPAELEYYEGDNSQELLTMLLKTDQAHLFFNRYGRLEYYNRYDFINRDVTKPTPAIQKADYEYGSKLVTQVIVKTQQISEGAEEVIWQSRRPITVPASSSTALRIIPDYKNGRRRNIRKVNSSTSTNQNVSVSVNPVGGDWELNLTNSSNVEQAVSVTVLGVLSEDEDGIGVVRSNAAYGVTKVKEVDVGFASIPVAESVADYVLRRWGTPEGEYIQLIIRQDDSLTINDVVAINDVQVAPTPAKVVIIGEQVEVSPNYISMQYNTTNIDPTQYMAVDQRIGDTGYELPLFKGVTSIRSQNQWVQRGLVFDKSVTIGSSGWGKYKEDEFLFYLNERPLPITNLSANVLSWRNGWLEFADNNVNTLNMNIVASDYGRATRAPVGYYVQINRPARATIGATSGTMAVTIGATVKNYQLGNPTYTNPPRPDLFWREQYANAINAISIKAFRNTTTAQTMLMRDVYWDVWSLDHLASLYTTVTAGVTKYYLNGLLNDQAVSYELTSGSTVDVPKGFTLQNVKLNTNTITGLPIYI